jgi:hypothetical protein
VRLRLLIGLLVVAVAFAAFVSRKRYDVEPFTTPSGQVFHIQKPVEWCPQAGRECLTRVSYEAPSLDSATFRRDALALAATFHDQVEQSGQIGVMLYGWRAGPFRLFAPDSGRVIVQLKVAARTWRVTADTAVGKVDWVMGKTGLW